MTVTATEASKLPDFNGRPVPWITRWSNEILRIPYSLEVVPGGTIRTVYPDGNEDRLGDTLWQREGLTRGGEPQWKSVNTYRQRKAMRRCHCQVCGDKIDTRPITFLMPMDGLEHLDENTVLTVQAPTCEACIPLALKLCPHLKKYGYQIVKAIDYSMWGIYGEVVFTVENQIRRMQTYIGYDQHNPPEFSLGQVVAKQQVIQLGKYVTEIHARKEGGDEQP